MSKRRARGRGSGMGMKIEWDGRVDNMQGEGRVAGKEMVV
jgi:hypothetical protein